MPGGNLSSKISKSAEVQEIAVSMFELESNLALGAGVHIPSRTIQLIGGIDEDTFAEVDSKITILETQGKKPITIRLFSGGGDPASALAIASRIRASKCKFVIEAHGMVASAAFLILASGHSRRMSQYVRAMHHSGSYYTEGSHPEIKAFVKQQEREHQLWCDTMASFSTMDSKFWYEEGLVIDRYYTPEEMLGMGVIDEIF